MHKISLFRSILGFASKLWKDTSGVILPYVTIMLVVIVGFSVLALDGARFVNLQTQLQHGADALALAGAAELNRMPDSACRATNAINAYIRNVYGPQAGENVTATSIRYLSSLPANDKDPITNANLAPDANPDVDCTHGSTVQFVEVTVGMIPMSTILPASFFGGQNTVSTGALAVAGSYLVVCNFTPLYICNPFEQAGDTYATATQRLIDATAPGSPGLRRLIQMKNDSQYSPGNFGFLNSPLGNGANQLIDSIARINPPACFQQSGVNTQPGTIKSAENGFNVRFDIYEGNLKNNNSDPNYPPAQNVRKGYMLTKSNGDYCKTTGGKPDFAPSSDQSMARGLPRDSDMTDATIRLGNGVWDCMGYWQVEHPPSLGHPPPQGCANGTLSRYQVYRHEIDSGYISDASPGDIKNKLPGETGAPRCSTVPGSTAADRRILFGAIINCQCLQAGNSCYPNAPNLSGNTPNVPVASFGKFFLTEPVVTSVYAELTGLVTQVDNNAFYTAQLYR
jgi:Flp pilus assembly protein TadG